MNISVNVWAVLVSGVLDWVIGALWYSPILFAKPWARLMKMDMESDEHAASPLLYLGALVVGLVLAAGLAVLLDLSGAGTVPAALLVAVVTWTAFTAAPAFANAIFGGSIPLWAINTAYRLVSVLLMSVILASWR